MHSISIQVGDPQEVNAIADFFCENRKTPLLLGSVKSNMGHSEPASGLCSVAKMVVAMEAGVIPANLHYTSPNTEIPALSDGRIKVSIVVFFRITSSLYLYKSFFLFYYPLKLIFNYVFCNDVFKTIKLYRFVGRKNNVPRRCKQ